MSAEARKPHFRFFPKAYEHGDVFLETSDACEICHKPAGWLYVGSIYTADPRVKPCASCIAHGRIGEALGTNRYCLHDAELVGTDKLTHDEIMQRTPGFASFNAFEWPVSRGLPLAFAGYGDDRAFAELSAARKAIREAGKMLGERDWDYPATYALVFQDLKRGSYHAIADLD